MQTSRQGEPTEEKEKRMWLGERRVDIAEMKQIIAYSYFFNFDHNQKKCNWLLKLANKPML